MQKIIEYLFSHFWFLEVGVRRIAYSNENLMECASGILKKISGKKKQDTTEVVEGLAESLFSYIRTLNIQKGDILIVHSGMDALSKTGLKPKEIIDFLLELVGEDGTLVFPAFPIFDVQKETKNVPIYDPKRTPCWTGILPNVFCRSYSDVIRSEFPTNSLAAKGPHAKDMMKDNLLGDLPHGKHSSWEYCVNHHAKILFLGVEAYHSNTVSHVAEEILDEEWPVKDWYEEVVRNIKQYDGQRSEFRFRRRREFWSQYAREYYAARVFKSKGYIVEKSISGLSVGYITDSYEFIKYIIDNAKLGKIIWVSIPKRHMKSN